MWVLPDTLRRDGAVSGERGVKGLWNLKWERQTASVCKLSEWGTGVLSGSVGWCGTLGRSDKFPKAIRGKKM